MAENGKSRRLFALVGRLARHVLPVVLALGLLMVIIAWLAGAFEEKISPHRRESPPADLAHLRTDIVHDETKEHIEEALGTLKAARRTVISAKLLATIDEIAVTAGDEVQEGDLLIRLNDSEYRARVQQAEQALKAAAANRIDAERDLARNEKLYEQQAVSTSTLEDSSRRLQVTSAEELRAERAADEARVMLSYTQISAPKSGRVVDRFSEPGDTARPGEPILVLYDASSLRLEATVSERLVASLRVGQELKAYIDAPAQEFDAVIDEIVPQADASSRSFLVKATLPNGEGLFEGMFGRLRIPAGQRRHLCLATAAIRRIGQLEFVDVVADGSLQRRMIRTGRLGMPGRVEVLSGLRAGDEIVIYDEETPAAGSDGIGEAL
jgi:RND family efflux transporter MFP subunit